MPATQKEWIKRLQQAGWTLERGGKHQVKMTKPGQRPVTLPENKRRAYAKASRHSCAARPVYRTGSLDPISMMRHLPEPKQLHVNVRHEDDALWATVDEFPGVFATGDDLNELRESLQQGIALILSGPGVEPPAVTVGELKLEPATMSAGVEFAYA